ncbi:MAG TPA: maleylpyruvate isomerase family mycothiol-dependent enzyme [Sporichthyaceae bacterium]|nr:maleylpyruvate isomerase family mycothiol-dependent enzyme [Sporichthyaceae bacterium]
MLDADVSLDLLATEGKLTTEAVSGRLDGTVPFCPGWTGRDLAVHLAGVYRWVSTVVGERMPEPPSMERRAGLYADPDPSDDQGVHDRLQQARSTVVATLRATPNDAQVWTIWPAGSPREFWIRRQLHETLVHRVDAQNLGRSEADVHTGAELDTALAADGVDEMMVGFSCRYANHLRNPETVTLAVQSTDIDRAWWCVIGPDDPSMGRGAPPQAATATVRGKSGELLLWLWNRRRASGLEVSGDPTALEIWTANAHL